MTRKRIAAEAVPLEDDANDIFAPENFLRAITDVQLLEVSTPEMNDVVRHEDDYGRTSAGTPLTETGRD